MEKVVIIFCFLLAIFLSSGCKKQGNNPDESKITIAVIPKGTVHEFWKSVHKGAEKAGNELDVNILWKGPLKEDDRESQISVVENMIVRRVDGIVIAPLDDTALITPVKNAQRQGIPVVVFDSGLKGSDYVSYVATDNFAGGQKAGKYMGRILNGKGKVVVLRYNEGSDSTTKRENGFLNAIKNYSEIKVVSDEQYAGVTTESAIQSAENLFTRFKDESGKVQIDGIFCACEPVALGIMQAVENFGILGEIKIVGFDTSNKMESALMKGNISGYVVQAPEKIGYLGVKTLYNHLKGKEVPERIDTDSSLITKEKLKQQER